MKKTRISVRVAMLELEGELESLDAMKSALAAVFGNRQHGEPISEGAPDRSPSENAPVPGRALPVLTRTGERKGE